MNVFLLLAVFSIGAFSSLIVSLLSDYIKNETLRYESVRRGEELIESRRLVFQKSLKLSSIPDDFQLSVFDAEIVPVDWAEDEISSGKNRNLQETNNPGW